jgi:3-phenylpropionate/trans-cinnamate dioxygenase ferredoxin subunit
MNSDNDHWIFAVEENKLLENSLTPIFPKGLPVLLIKKDGKIYCLSNKCAHMACGLTAGSLKEYAVQCPCHDWKFDIRTGEFLSAREIKIPTFPCRTVNGKVFVHIGGGGS